MGMIEILSHGTVRELCLSRPPVNALNTELLADLSAAVVTCADEGCSGIVVSGYPGIFTAGLDLPQLMTLNQEEMQHALGVFLDAIYTLASCPIPTAAAITGHSPAGGAVLALCCDRRIMARGDWRIGLNEVEVGIPMPRTVAALATWVLGQREAARMCCEALFLTPEEALTCGFVDQLEPDKSVVQAAVEWCEGLKRLSVVASRRSRRRMRAELVHEIALSRDADLEDLLSAWFEPEVRESLLLAVERIRGKG
ncbi:MAG: enoyl-CoA hydratase/isomerase family protein [bacterium]|nr:enoyl-CoA hydratase/isomerase family protein [bacterium]